MKELPKFTEGPWEKDKYGTLKCPKGQPIRLWGSGFVHSSRSDETEANNRLTEASLALYMALWAQEVAIQIENEPYYPAVEDPRYIHFLGPWNGKDSEGDRYRAMRKIPQQLRTKALKQARGE